MFTKNWDYLVRITDISKRGDKYIGRAPNNKVVMLPMYSDLTLGMEAPIHPYSERKTYILGALSNSVTITESGQSLFLPMSLKPPLGDDQELSRWIERYLEWERFRVIESDQQRKEYQREYDMAQSIVDRVIDRKSRRSTGNYMSEYRKHSLSPLTKEETKAIRLVFGLPPWGVQDRGLYVHTDSYTD